MVSANNTPEDYQTSLTDDQKTILDDAPAKVVKHLLDYTDRNGYPIEFKVQVTDKLTGHSSGRIQFEGPSAVNGIDYLRYLIRNGYKDLADAG